MTGRQLVTVLVFVSVTAVACGGGGQARPSASGSKSPSSEPQVTSPSPGAAIPLLVLLEGSPSPSRIALVDLTGSEVAGASFEPGVAPRICGAGFISPPLVRIVGSSAYFIDGAGVVRRLARGRPPVEVARIPVGTQQQPYFAVSPDGRHVMASVVTMPAVNPNAANPSDCSQGGPGPTVETFIADDGGALRSLGRMAMPPSSDPTVVAGWDLKGPFATAETGLGRQAPTPTDVFSGKRLVRLDPLTGNPTGEGLGGADCKPLDAIADGTVLCSSVSDWSALSVRRSDGSVLWAQEAPACCPVYGTPRLAPDGLHIALDQVLLGPGSSIASFPRVNAPPQRFDGFIPFGWIDSTRLVGGDDPRSGSFQVVSVSDPGHSTPFPVSGRFAGAIAAG